MDLYCLYSNGTLQCGEKSLISGLYSRMGKCMWEAFIFLLGNLQAKKYLQQHISIHAFANAASTFFWGNIGTFLVLDIFFLPSRQPAP